MNTDEALRWCDEVITEIDIQLMEWTTEVDRMSFIGQNVPLEWHANGEIQIIGTASLVHDGSALDGEIKLLCIDPEYQDHPVVTMPPGSYSLGYDPGPPARVVAKPVPSYPPFEGFNKPLSRDPFRRVVEGIIPPEPYEFENHQFFKEQK